MGSIIIITDPEALEIISIIAMCLYFLALVAFGVRTYQVLQFPFTSVHWLIIVFAAVRAMDYALGIPATIDIIFNSESPDFTLLWLSSIFDSLARPLFYVAFFLSINRWVAKIQAAKGEGPRPGQPRRKWSMENLMWLAMTVVCSVGAIQAMQNIMEWIVLVDYSKIRLYSFILGFYLTMVIGYLIVTVFLNATILLYYLRYKFIAVVSQFHLLITVSSLLYLPVIFDFCDAFAAINMLNLDSTGNSFEAIYFFLYPLPEVVIISILAWRADEFAAITRLRSRGEQPLERLGA